MPVSSLLVRTDPERAAKVAEDLGQVPGTEVTDIKGDQIVVVTDTRSAQEDRDLHEKLEDVPGVLAVTLVYHNYEDLEEEACLRV